MYCLERTFLYRIMQTDINFIVPKISSICGCGVSTRSLRASINYACAVHTTTLWCSVWTELTKRTRYPLTTDAWIHRKPNRLDILGSMWLISVCITQYKRVLWLFERRILEFFEYFQYYSKGRFQTSESLKNVNVYLQNACILQTSRCQLTRIPNWMFWITYVKNDIFQRSTFLFHTEWLNTQRQKVSWQPVY